MVFKLMSIFQIFVVFVSGNERGFKYPIVRKDEAVIDDYFGTKVPDPYRWLEDLNSAETKEFIKQQNEFSNSYISTAPSRAKIRDTLTKLWTYPKEGLPRKEGNNYFLEKNSGIQNQSIHYKGPTVESLYKNDAEILLNPNDFSSDGTISVGEMSYSKNGEFLAYALSQSGSDWSNIHIRNVASGKDLQEVLQFCKGASLAWTLDNLGFFYSRYPETREEDKLYKGNENRKTYYHRLGTSQEQDSLMVEFPNPDLFIYQQLSDDGEYLLVTTFESVGEHTLFYAILVEPINDGLQNELVLIQLTTIPAIYTLLGNDGHIFYFLTNVDAPNNRVIGMDMNNSDKSHWSTLVAENEQSAISWAKLIAKDKLLVSYTQDVKSTFLELRNLGNGTLITKYPLQTGSIKGIEGKRDDFTFYFSLSTFTSPEVSYKLEFGENGAIPKRLEIHKRTEFKGLDTLKYETKQIFYPSTDGTKVPMFIVKRRALVPTSNTPALLTGYGGYQVSNEPYFSVEFLSFMSMFDGIFALANIRGGGEYGRKWWEDGRLLNKQNSFDDFQSAAEYLIQGNYTSSSKLTIIGASNGGLLVTACANQRPELFGAVVAQMAPTDMLRYQKFTIGSFHCGEFGCSGDKTHFNNLIKYSPLHNVNPGKVYPAMIVLTGEADDVVVPLHSYKYTAQLQGVVGSFENQTQPLMLRVEEKVGHHGYGKPTWKQIEEYVDIYSFLQLTLKYDFVDVKSLY